MQTSENSSLLWHSRRGMLELDLLLVPFTTSYYDKLTPELQRHYRLMLDQEDSELAAWLVRRQAPPAPFVDIVKAVLEYAAKRR